MSFVVSARKYRPTRFDEVVGQEHVSQTLKNAMANDHLAHAFLFCGPRGVGKTTCARILAKVLNCLAPTKDHEPCNICDSCQSFNKNASFNITELDAASNNSVEHIRALIEQVRFQPQQGQYKIFIIDEVHMLSQQAFNAFLKTLEEPPPYAKFILATTEKHKIIPTILSRCQIFDFNRIQIPAMIEHLQGICKAENIDADRDALHIVAQKADGALRDALSIFDRITSFSKDKITYETVITNLNVLDYDYYFKIVDAMLLEDVAKVMVIFDDILRKGFDPSVFINGLAEHFRNILVCQDAETLKLLEVGDNLKKRYLKQAAITPTALLLTALNLANTCDVNYKMARNKRLHVEMTIIKMTFINRMVKATTITQTPPPQKKNIITTETPSNPLVTNDIVSTYKTRSTQKTSTNTTIPKPKLGNKLKKVGLLKSSLKLTSIASIEKDIEQEEQQNKQDKIELSQASLDKYWKTYIGKITSNYIKATFTKVKPKLKGTTIHIIVSTSIDKDNIQNERTLMPFLKKQLMTSQLFLEIEVDKSLAPKIEKPKKPTFLTPREKYLKMRKINPTIDELRRRFDLDLER